MFAHPFQSSVVQWLGYLAFTEETRVQFPAGEQLQKLQFEASLFFFPLYFVFIFDSFSPFFLFVSWLVVASHQAGPVLAHSAGLKSQTEGERSYSKLLHLFSKSQTRWTS